MTAPDNDDPKKYGTSFRPIINIPRAKTKATPSNSDQDDITHKEG